MTNGGEIIGDLAQGALTARALEPGHGEGDAGHSHEHSCLNCGTSLIGSHCHGCGQAAHVHRTLGAFFHDLLHGVFHFEGKVWRTLPLLAWKPGKLTREYIDGRRASYVSPIALFLFCVFLMFAVVKQFAGEFDPAAVLDGGKSSAGSSITVQTKHLDALKAERAKLVAAGQPTAAIDGQITGQEQAIEALSNLKDADFEKLGAHSDVPAIDRTLKELTKNPRLVFYKLQNNAYKYSWALIPISVPFVWLLFAWRRRYHLYDHTVFVTYSMCFMTLLVVVLTLGNAAGAPLIAVLALVIPPWHMYRQLRGTYALSRFSALWRTAALLGIAVTAMILFTMLVLAETGGA